MILDAEADIEVVGQAVDGLDAIEQALALRPDVIVMDLRMPRASGVVATREINARLPNIGVVVLTTYDEDDLVFDAILAGARAYLLKDASEAEILDTIRAVARHETRLSPSIACKVLERFRQLAKPGAPAMRPAEGVESTTPAPMPGTPPPVRPAHEGAPLTLEEPLTAKEQRILELIAQGLSNKQIGAKVFLAEGTVKNYVSRIMEKLHARSRTELAVRATERRD